MNTKKRKMYAEMCVAFRKVRKLESFSHVFVQIYCPSRPSQRKWELYYLDQSPLWNCFKWLLFADLTSILKAYSTIQIYFFFSCGDVYWGYFLLHYTVFSLLMNILEKFSSGVGMKNSYASTKHLLGVYFMERKLCNWPLLSLHLGC